MPRPYPPEFRARAIALVRSGKQIKQTAYELGISSGCLHEWLKQDRIDHGEIPGKTTTESAELCCDVLFVSARIFAFSDRIDRAPMKV